MKTVLILTLAENLSLALCRECLQEFHVMFVLLFLLHYFLIIFVNQSISFCFIVTISRKSRINLQGQIHISSTPEKQKLLL